jgi:hypothetical protein
MRLKERLEFWWAKTTIKDGRDFEIQVDEDGMYISILKGKFRGVRYRYSPLTVLDDEGLVDFRTIVEYIPENVGELGEDFSKLTTKILRILLSEAIPETINQTKQEYEQVTNENGNIDTGELTQERDFYEESTPLLEKRVSRRKSRKKVVPTDSGLHPEIQQPAKSKRTGNRTPRAKRPK